MLSWTELETENQLLALSKNEGPARVSGAFVLEILLDSAAS